MPPEARFGFSDPSGRASTTPVTLRQYFAAQVVCALGYLGLTEDDLCHAGAVAQIDENDATVVASATNPSGQGHFIADIFWAQFARKVCAQHVPISPSSY